MILNDRERAIRQRLKDDFPHYARKCLKIRAKSGKVLPFELNSAQQILHEAAESQIRECGKVRIIIVKGRQQGCSTYIAGRGYHKTTYRKGWRSYILTHEQDATDNLFDMVQRFHENCPSPVKPATDAANAKELDFGALDSGYRVGTAGTKGKGRSSTVQFFHGSEVAYWPLAETHAAGVLQAIPYADDTEIWYESTGNGIGNFFHAQWQLAEAGRSDFRAVFIPWYIQSEYRRPVPEGFRLDDDERDYMDANRLDLEQMAWRRAKITELHNDPNLFAQEYPANSREAFQAGDEDVYIPISLAEKAREATHLPVGPKVLGVDVARFGDDRSAICFRQGRKVHWIKAYEKQDLMAVVGLVKVASDEVKPDAIFVDVVGIGAGVVDRLKEMGVANVFGAGAGERALDDDKYFNRRAEMFHGIKEWLSDGADLPKDEAIATDISSLKYTYDSKGRLKLESKDDAKKRGVRSPDLADALALTFYRPVVASNTKAFDPNSFSSAGGWMR